MQEKTDNTGPVYTSRHGAVSGAVWENQKEGPTGKFTSYFITTKKSFSTDDGKTWLTAKGYFAQDMNNYELVIKDIKGFLKEIDVPTKVKEREGGEK